MTEAGFEQQAGSAAPHASDADHDVVLSVRDVTVAFGDNVVLDDLSLDVYRGEILGFVGAEVGSSVIQSRMPEMEELSHVTVHPSMPAILVSVGFSMLTGLVFGLYPARRAARMSPIDALRYE